MAKIIKKKKKISKSIGNQFSEADTSLKREKKVKAEHLVPTGSTTFNLECSGRIEGAFRLGKMVNLIGDSHAGKTLFALTVFAECSLLKRFDKFKFIYDDVEVANEFDMADIFGKSVDKRIAQSNKELFGSAVGHSRTVEEFNDNLATLLEQPEPFIYILDSADSLTSEAALKKDAENRKKRKKGLKTDGSYGDGKAKAFSEMFSKRIQELDAHGSCLIIISQTRDNIGFGAMFTPKTRSGGRALKFYAFHEVWLACQKKEKEKKRTMLTNTQAKITKNKLTGNHGEAFFPILRDYGVDNIKSCIRFLVEEGPWSGTGSNLKTKGFVDDSISLSKLVSHIENNDLEDDLFQVCQVAFDTIMTNLKPKRKRKY